MRATLSALGLGDVQLQEFGAPTDVLIRVAQQPGGEQAQQAAIAKVRQALGSDVEYRRVEVVGPRVSTELLAKSTLGLGLAIFAILVYLWFRFEWQFALGAMIANVHDLVLTIGYMSLMQIDFDLSSIAALLTILGYSLNDTVVIYDRIREMLRRYKRMSTPELLNISVNSTLSRSIITHLTVTLALLALLFFGGHAIHSFIATMIFGVVLVGTYTSVFIAAPILIYLGVGTARMEATEEPAETQGPGAQAIDSVGSRHLHSPLASLLARGHAGRIRPLRAAGARRPTRIGFSPTLFAPAEHRGALFALYAFNLEVARVREVVREPLAGEIRLQWWRDVAGR